MWCNKYIGIPYKDKGRDETGVDCWGLARLIYENEYNIKLPSLSSEYINGDTVSISELFAQYSEGWEKLDTAKEGDLVLFRVLGIESHVGVMISSTHFIHARENQTVVIESITSSMWEHRVLGYYKYLTNTGVILAAVPNPLKTDRIDMCMPAGITLGELSDWIIKEKNVPLELIGRITILIDGTPIELSESNRNIILTASQRVEYRILPAGGGFFRKLLVIAVIIAATIYGVPLGQAIGTAITGTAPIGAAVAGWTFAGQMIITTIGMALVNAIAPIRMPEPIDRGDPGSSNPQLMLHGSRNELRAYQAIPVVLGQYRYVAPLGGINHLKVETDTSYLKMLLVWGYGPLTIEDIRVGAAPISSYDIEGSLPTINTVYGTETDYPTALSNVMTGIYGPDVYQAVSNTLLVYAEPITLFCTTTAGSAIVNTGGTGSIIVGSTISGNPNIPVGYTVLNIINSTSFTISSGTGVTSATSVLTTFTAHHTDWLPTTVIPNLVTDVAITIHFPEGLRGIYREGGSAGDSLAAVFTAELEIQEIDVNLAPVGAWKAYRSIFATRSFTLPVAWTSSDAYWDDSGTYVPAVNTPKYQWNRIYLDKSGLLRVVQGPLLVNSTDTTGAATEFNSYYDNGSGYFFGSLSIQRPAKPSVFSGSLLVYDIQVYGDTVYTTVDNRAGNVLTGGDLSLTGMLASIAGGTLNSIAITYGGAGTPFYLRKDAFSVTLNFNGLTRSRYQVRIRRTNSNLSDLSTVADKPILYHKAYLYLVTAIDGNNSPIITPKNIPLCITALSIKATDQLNGSIEGINALVKSICLDYNSTTWVARPTSNPASLFRYMLQHPANAQRILESEVTSKIDIANLETWHTYCNTNGFTYNAVIVEQRSLLEILKDICAAGRASPMLIGGKWHVVIDKPRSSIIQHFTPHNSWGFEGSKVLSIFPHALRVTFINANKNYQSEELMVYNDGYTSENASIFEALQLPGVTSAESVYKQARFHLAQAKLRPEVYSLSTDMEHLVCTRGDLVRVTHDVPMWGTGTGRIKTFISTTQLELDEEVQLLVNTNYQIRIRTATGSSVLRAIEPVTSSGIYTTIILTASVSSIEGEASNLFMIGVTSSESVELIVTSIEPSNNLTAKITLVDYSPDIYTSDSLAIPQFNSRITSLPQYLRGSILVAPTIISSNIRSDESVMSISGSSYVYKISIPFQNPPNLNSSISTVEARIDMAEDTSISWRYSATTTTSASSIIFSDVEEGRQYAIQLRYISSEGNIGPWSPEVLHTIVGKSTPPAQVSNMVVAIEANQAKISWNKNTELDVVGYEVRAADSNWGTTGAIFNGNTNSCLAPISVAGVPNTWYVRALDAAKLYSTVSSSVTITSSIPSTPSTPMLAIAGTDLVVTWAFNSINATQLSIDFYELKTASNVSIWKGSTAQTKVSLIGTIGVQSYKLYAVDTQGNISVAKDFSYEIILPINVASETVLSTFGNSLTDASLTLSWGDVLPIFGLAEYEVTYDSIVVHISSTTLVISTLPTNWIGNKTFTIKTVDLLGNKSSGTSIVVNKQTPTPISASTFISQIIDNNVMLYWTVPTRTSLPISHILVKRGPVWETADLIGEKSGTFTTIFERKAGTYTYWLATVDTDKQVSTPVSIVAKVSQPPDFVFNDEFTSTFYSTSNSTVTLSNAVVDNNKVVLPINVTEQFGSHFSTRNWTSPNDQVVAGYPIYIQPANTSGYFEEVMDLGTLYNSSLVTLSYNGEVKSGNPTVVSTISISADNVTYSTPYSGLSLFSTGIRYIKVRISIAQEAPVVRDVTTTASSSTAIVSSTTGLKVGNTITGNANIPAGILVAAIIDSTTITLSTGTGVTSGSSVSTSFGSVDRLYHLTYLNVRLDAKIKDDAGVTENNTCVSTHTDGTTINFNTELVDVTSVTVTPKGINPLYAVYDFKDVIIPATYSIASNVCTISTTEPHGFSSAVGATGQRVRLSFSSGTGISGVYPVASVTNSTVYTVNMTAANTTSQSVSTYSQGMRIYLFNSSGSRATGDVSWAIRGY